MDAFADSLIHPTQLHALCGKTGDNTMTNTNIDRLLSYQDWYEDQLEHVISFWLERSLDQQYGGYFVPINRKGQVLGCDKNIWCQARMTWMFSAMYNHIAPRKEWLDAAKLGRDFIVNHSYLGEGRWAYLLDRQGKILNDNLSLTTDNNVAMALSEYVTACDGRGDDDIALIQKTFAQYVSRLGPPAANQWYHHNLSPDYLYNAVYMVTLGGIPAQRAVIDKSMIEPLADQCAEKILFTLAKDEYKTLFEAVGLDGQVKSSETGQRVNPGHALEAAWFCLEQGLHKKDSRITQRGALVARWMFDIGWDEKLGGIKAFTNPHGGKPQGAELPTTWGERWDDRIWWVHSEALYALALSSTVTDDKWYMDSFDKLHDYVTQHFVDKEHGEWYAYLDKYGEIKSPLKGNWIKCCFHIPRNLMKMVLLLRHLKGHQNIDGLID